VDEGDPIAYEVLAEGVPVLCSDGVQVGKVHHVVAAVEEDIFHGLVIATPQGRRFVAADEVASLHERGVDLRIDSAAAAELPAPGGGAPEYVENPSETKWSHWARRMTGRKDWNQRR
jgi:hypothetical protein